ncbi:MAG: nucleotide exchange factor GrpE [Planctomycetaceae bacterium]
MSDESQAQAAGDAADQSGASMGGDPAGESVEALQQQLERAHAERETTQQKWLMALADLDTYRRRVRKEADEARRFAVRPLAEDLLPARDNLHRALEAARSATDVAQLVQGVQMVIRQFDDVLVKHQVTAIEAVGRPFDPNLHQALQQQQSADHPPMTVLAEYQRGYQMHDRVIRPSTMVVAAPPAN